MMISNILFFMFKSSVNLLQSLLISSEFIAME